MTAVVAHLVHGTWARGIAWPLLQAFRAAFPLFAPSLSRRFRQIWVDEGSAFRMVIEAPNRSVTKFDWSGSNSFAARRQAAIDFAHHLRTEVAQAPHAAHVIIAHSHGGNVAVQTLTTYCDPKTRDAVQLLITMATPFLTPKGSAYPRIRRALTLGRLLALMIWIMFPTLFWVIGISWGTFGMITPSMGLAPLWQSVVVVLVSASLLLTSDVRMLRAVGVVIAIAWTCALSLVSPRAIAATFGVQGVDVELLTQAQVPHLDALTFLACSAWYVLAWRSSVTGAEALRDVLRVVLLTGVPLSLVAIRLFSELDLFATLAWDAGAVAIVPSFAAGTALASVSLLFTRSGETPLKTSLLTARLLAVRLPGDEASRAINAARLLEGLGAFLYRSRHTAVPVAVMTTVLSPLFFVQGFGFVASAAYGGLAVIVTNIFGSVIAQGAYGLFLVLAVMTLGAMIPVLSLAATLPLSVGIGPEVLFGLSTRDVSCDELPVESGAETKLEVLVPSQASTPEGLRHSAYNYPCIQRRVVDELASLQARLVM